MNSMLKDITELTDTRSSLAISKRWVFTNATSLQQESTVDMGNFILNMTSRAETWRKKALAKVATFPPTLKHNPTPRPYMKPRYLISDVDERVFSVLRRASSRAIITLKNLESGFRRPIAYFKASSLHLSPGILSLYLRG
jgi:hypothetical protein